MPYLPGNDHIPVYPRKMLGISKMKRDIRNQR